MKEADSLAFFLIRVIRVNPWLSAGVEEKKEEL